MIKSTEGVDVMTKREKKSIAIISAVVYFLLFAFTVLATIDSGKYDIVIDKAVFEPNSVFAKFFEDFGQAVMWAMWGPAFAVIFLCRRDLNGCLQVINRLFSKIKPFESTDERLYKVLNFALQAVETLGFFTLCGIGWKKLIENVTKNILKNAGRENLGQLSYFLISFAVAALSIFLLSRIDKKTLRKLEGVALSFVLFGLMCKIVEECKTVTHRVRFREMVAYSNGFFNSDGLSEGKNSPLTRQMLEKTDFGAFTPWYRKSITSGEYDYRLFSRTDSFPSGHTLNACVTFLSVLVCTAFEKLKKFAPLALCVSVIFTFFMAFTRLKVGAHYLSDVVGAMIIGYTLFLFVFAMYDKFSERKVL